MRSKKAAAVAAAGSPLAGLAAAGNNVWAVGDQAQGSPVSCMRSFAADSRARIGRSVRSGECELAVNTQRVFGDPAGGGIVL